MSRAEVEDAIKNYERTINGFDRLSGATVDVQITCISDDLAIADVTLSSSEDGPEEKYRDCIYPIPTLMNWKGGET